MRRPHQAVEADGIDIFFCRPDSLQESDICRPTTKPSSYRPSIHKSCLITDPAFYRSSLTSSTDPASPDPSCLRALLNTSAAALPKSFNTDILPTLIENLTESSLSKMSTYADRLASFTEWPHASPTAEQMARAGFVHTPTNVHPDNVRCSRCSDSEGNLCDWEPDNDPAIQRHIHHLRCSRLWLVFPLAGRKLPSIKDIGFFDLSLAYDFPDLCLFRNVNVFCDRIKRLRFFEDDILDVLPSCLRGDALKWLNQSKHRDLAACLGALRARFWQQAPPEPSQAPPEAPLEAPQPAPQLIDYHHCKLCNASFSSMARLIRHTQENICNKPSCRHCEKVFSSKNQLHRHLREECRKQTRSSSASSSRSSPKSSPSLSSAACSSTCSPISSPAPSPAPSPPPRYQSISPPPPYYLTMADLSAGYAKPPCLSVDDLFRMFGGSSATTKSSTATITIALDDPFARPFVSFIKSLESTRRRDWGMATSHHQIALAQCSAPRSICERCRRPPLLEQQYRQEATRPNWA